MRSSKNRSRSSNKNRNRSAGNMGHIVNRVFDSSGPEGKVRGTPQQIIDKYNQLARDAQLSGDRVALENFQQHAEHYMRMLAEAQREQDSRREQQEQQNRERQAERDRDRERAERQERESNGRPQKVDSDPASAPQPSNAPQPDVIDTASAGDDSGLVETPESAAPQAAPQEEAEVKKPKPRARRKPRKAPTEEAEANKEPDAAE